MIVVHGPEGGLPEFGQTEQICVWNRGCFSFGKSSVGGIENTMELTS